MYTKNFPVIHLSYELHKSREVTLTYYKKNQCYLRKVNVILENLLSGPSGRVEETEITANSCSKNKQENNKASIQIHNAEMASKNISR